MNANPIHRPDRVRLAAASGLALAALLAACTPAAPPPPPPPQVTVAAAVSREITEWDEFTGRFEATNTVEVRPRVSGFVRAVAFAEGAVVHQGDVLFEIDPRPYQDEVARAAAEVARARTRLSLSGSELERAGRLVAAQAISREEFEARGSGRAEGVAALQSAEAALRSARLNLEWTRVRAPLSGRVSRAEVTPGNLVQAGPPAATLLTTVVSLDPIYVYFDGDEQSYLKFAGLSRPGSAAGRAPVSMGLANEQGFPHEGVVDFVDNRLDPVAGTIRARAVFRNPGGAFTPGMFARVRLAGSGKYTATLVDDRAVGTDQDRKFVLVLKPDATVDYRPVTTGPLHDGLRVIRDGLRPGERIVVNGLQRVRPGMKVAARDTAMAGPSATAVALRAP
ncbi:MAG: transporter subunit [Gemmatimonadetes bacterium]|nr:transporter subunit [Gemmatimonadota bacterium]